MATETQKHADYTAKKGDRYEVKKQQESEIWKVHTQVFKTNIEYHRVKAQKIYSNA